MNNLQEINGVGPKVAEKLEKAGLTVDTIKEASVDDLVKIGIKEPVAKNIVETFKTEDTSEPEVNEPETKEPEVVTNEPEVVEEDVTLKPSDMIELTFEPVRTALKSVNLSLSEKKVSIENGREIVRTVSAIKGLPMTLTVKAGQIIRVTKEQFDELMKMGFIDTPQSISVKNKIEENLEPQHPEDVKIEQNIHKGLISPQQMRKVYTEVLTVAR